jgi:hypothetical protein
MAGGNGRYKAQDFIDAIPGTGGIVSVIAKRVGCAWHTAKKYIVEYATVTEAYQDECEAITDLAETTVIKSIKDGDTQTAKWYLTMKGRNRGYAMTQRQELTGTDGGPLVVRYVNDWRNPEDNGD